MAWIELHQSIWTHRKTFIFADKLGIDETYAAAHLIRFWTWALDNVQDGVLTGLSNRLIAFGAGWKGDADYFVDSAIASGWFDDTESQLSIHDWDDYAGKLILQRDMRKEQTRDRVQKYRNKQKECNAHVTRYGNGGVTQCNALPNQPHLTNHTIPNQPHQLHEEAVEVKEGERKVFQFFNQNVGAISPYQEDEISNHLNDGMEPEMIIAVMKDSLGKRDKWSWVRKVLNNSVTQNIKTLEQYNAKRVECENTNSRDRPVRPPSPAASQTEMLQRVKEKLRRQSCHDD